MSSLSGMDQAMRDYSAAHAVLMRAVAAFVKSGEWTTTSARDAASFLAARYDVTLPTARQWVTEAGLLGELPALSDAYAQAVVSVDQARSIGRLADDDDHARMWLELLPQWSIEELHREARKATARKIDRQDGGRYVRMGWTADERFMTIDGRLHPDEGAVVMQAIERAIPENVPIAQLGSWYADGLVGMAHRSLSSDADQDRATVVIHIDKTTTGRGPCSLVTPSDTHAEPDTHAERDTHSNPNTNSGPDPHTQPDPHGNSQPASHAGESDGKRRTPPELRLVGELECGGHVPMETVERCTCDARIEYVQHDDTGREVGIDRAARNIPPWLYRQLRRRDRQCVFRAAMRRVSSADTTSSGGAAAAAPTCRI